MQEGKLEVLLLALPVTEGNSFPCRYMMRVCAGIFRSEKISDRPGAPTEGYLREQVLLLEEDTACGNRHWSLQYGRSAESQEFRASSLNTLVQMVANGMGITLLPRLAVDVEVRRSSNLKTIPFSEPVPVRQVGLVWRKQSARQEEFRLLYEVFLNNLPAEVQMIQTVSGQTDSEAGSLRSRG